MKYTIREMMKELTGLTDLQWGGYAFYHEPLERKFTPEQKENYTRLANKCGEEEAESLLSEYPEKSIGEIAGELGFTVKTPEEVSKMLNLPLEEIKKVQEQQMTENR